MTTYGSATAHEETPHESETPNTPISDALRRRAQSLIDDGSIDPKTRALIRYALEISDPWLARIVRLVDAGESIDGALELFETETPKTDEEGSSKEKIEALAE